MLGKEKRRKLHQIMGLALDVSQGKADVFFHYSPHTHQFDVQVYEQGWSLDVDCDTQTTLYIQGQLANKLSDFNKVIRNLKRLKAKECKEEVKLNEEI